MYLTVWYVNTYIQFSDVLCIHIQFSHKPPSGVGCVMNSKRAMSTASANPSSKSAKSWRMDWPFVEVKMRIFPGFRKQPSGAPILLKLWQKNMRSRRGTSVVMSSR